MEVYGVEVDERVSGGDGSGVVGYGAVVYDVCVEDSIGEEGKGADEDAVGFGEERKDRSLGVSESVDCKELAT